MYYCYDISSLALPKEVAMDTGSVRVAIAQASPVYLDREATVEKACRLIAEAGARGASLVAFPEGFIPGHPLWYHFHAATGPVSRQLATRLYRNSVVIPGPETAALGAAAARAGCQVMIGVCERASAYAGTLYNSQVLIGADGRILNVHRKLTPTVGERLVHAPGDARGLRVVDTPTGRISGLICGESSNPLALFALIAEATQIHVISWPDFPGRGMLSRAERALVASRGLAFMSKAYILNAIGILSEEMRATIRSGPDDDAFLEDPSLTGGSSIVGPDGNVVAGPVDHTEQLLVADLDLGACLHEKAVHDLAGHYNRSDIFTLHVDRSRHEIFVPDGDSTVSPVGEPPAASGTETVTTPEALHAFV
jgi:nitrilase